MVWEMITGCLENMLPSIITGHIFLRNTMVSKIQPLMAEGQPALIYHASGMYSHSKQDGFGVELKKNLSVSELGPWSVGSHMMGETIPKESNYVALDKAKKDEWGMPLLNISIDYDENDEKMVKDFQAQLTEMYT